MSDINVAIVGLGFGAEFIPIYQRLKGVNLYAICQRTQSKLDDGTLLTWRRDGPLAAKEEAGLRFVLDRAAGDTASLEPYLGMPGHAVVVRDDGRVFIHLHPMGTISPAAQARLSPASPMHFTAHASQRLSDSLYFPYAFPEPGRYTVWVQLKRTGRVLTGTFSVDVR
jgi:hypothetical protein